MFKDKHIKISGFKLKTIQPFFKSQSVSGKFQRRFSGIQYYEIEFTANYTADNVHKVRSFITRHQFGRPFTVPLSYYTEYKGDVKGVITAGGAGSRGGRKIQLSNFAGTLKAGDVIQFENHKKLYSVLEDVKGGGTLKVFPNLYQDVLAGEIIRYRNVEGEFLLSTDNIEYNIQQIDKMQLKGVENV